jgi:O-succinylbenzoic acid--CoA ligase
VVLGGSAPPAELPANVHPTYGLTETGSGIVYDGYPIEGAEIAIDPTTGEIRVRGPMLLRAYRDGTVPTDTGGWFATGDAGGVDPEGRLQVDGRLSELIITGGENVWPTPVERIIARLPGVAEVSVAGRPDAEWGERVVAWIVPELGSDGPSLEAVRDLVRAELAPYAAPRQLIRVGTLPKTSLGKVQRSLLPDA